MNKPDLCRRHEWYTGAYLLPEPRWVADRLVNMRLYRACVYCKRLETTGWDWIAMPVDARRVA